LVDATTSICLSPHAGSRKRGGKGRGSQSIRKSEYMGRIWRHKSDELEFVFKNHGWTEKKIYGENSGKYSPAVESKREG